MKKWHAYALSVAAVLIAIIVRLLFLKLFGNQYPFLVFHPAVAVAATVGGFWPGMLATVLSIVATHFFWLDPMQHWFNRLEMAGIQDFFQWRITCFLDGFGGKQCKKKASSSRI